jgi:predicted nuclease with TOPRIM domain
MDMDIDGQPININISRATEREDKYNEFKEYLVINNLQLQQEIKEIRNENNDLKKEIESKEQEEDKYDNRTRYMKGLLINLNEMKKGYNEIAKSREKLVNITNSNWHALYKLNRKLYIDLLILSVIFILENILFQIFDYSKLKITFYIILHTSLIYIVINKYKSLLLYIKEGKQKHKPEIDNIINFIDNKIKELVKVEDSTLSLENWINEV